MSKILNLNPELIPKNHQLLTPYQHDDSLQTLLKVTNGYYACEQAKDHIIIYDLRFGRFGDWGEAAGDFIFIYTYWPETGVIKQKRERVNDMGEKWRSLIQRLRGRSKVSNNR